MEPLKIAFVFSILLSFATAASILGVFPIPSKSHDILGFALLNHLSSIGHNVTYISTYFHQNQKNFHHIHIKECLQFKEEHMKEYSRANSTAIDMLLQLFNMGDLTTKFFENKSVQELIKSDSKFDLLIHFFGIDATLALGDHFDVPIIVFSPVGGFSPLDALIGNPTPSSYVPNLLLPFTDEMNLIERTVNTIANIAIFPLLKHIFSWSANKCIETYLPGSSTFQEVLKRIDLVLLNTHISIETPRPHVPNMIQIGGYHLQTPDPLSQDLKKVLDDAKEGFIYFSFGTNVNVNELPDHLLNMFKKVLGDLPLTVIMKYDDDTMSHKPDNFILRKWFPQPSVLAHPNAKLFISHGGYGGCMESLFYGVPMVCIPFFADQPKNCANAKHNGYSITVNLNELTDETFSAALQKVLYDEKFKEAVKFKSEMYRDQPMNPMDKAVYWIEHVIKHKGAKHLKVKGAEMSWYQYHLIDVFLLIGVTLSITVTFILYTCRFFIGKLCLRQNKVKVN